MVRWLFLLIVVGAAAGYFTRPNEATMRTEAEAVLNDPATLEQFGDMLGAAVAGQRRFDDYFVATKYTVTIGENPAVECWGAFQQIRCSRVDAAASS
jgi:hypothetical protein